LAARSKQVESFNVSYGKIRDEHTANQTKLTTAEELLQTLLTGLSSKGANNSGGGYMGQLADARSRIAQGEAEEEQSKVKLGMSEKELKTLEGRWKEVEKEAQKGKRNVEAMQASVQDHRRKVAESGWSEEMEKAGDAKLREAKAEVRSLNDVRFLKECASSQINTAFFILATRTGETKPWTQAQLRLRQPHAKF
jgi:structural maintenance of chromosome 2